MEKGKVKRGFKAFRDNVKDDSRKLRQIRNCQSCKYYFIDVDSYEEICFNNSVTSYDMVIEDNIKYCTFWTPSWHQD